MYNNIMKEPIKKSEELINKIKSSGIKQKPRWYCILENVVFWSIFFLSIILGGIAFSIILYAIGESDFNLLRNLSSPGIRSLISFLPFVWILFLGVSLTIAALGIRNTKKGYRYSLLWILGVNILLSVLFGFLFFYTGGGQNIERIFAKRVGIYTGIEERKISRWSRPESGFLSGMILEKQSDNILLLEDFTGKKWQINIQDVVIHFRLSLESGEKIKIIGIALEENIFRAEEIRVWEGSDFRRK
jgi:hypothetical protein